MVVNYQYPCNLHNYRKGRARPIAYLVIHYVGATGGSEANAKYYHSTALANPASAHYFVGHKDKPVIFCSVNESDTAWAVGAKQYLHPYCRNDNSISIELCCHNDGHGGWYFDAETVLNGIELARDIVTRYHIPFDNLLRHYDVTGKICPAPFVWEEDAWNEFKRRVYKMDWKDEFADAWKWAKDRGYMDGNRPDDPVTRNELATILKRMEDK